jgi:hypothetical protein
MKRRPRPRRQTECCRESHRPRWSQRENRAESRRHRATTTNRPRSLRKPNRALRWLRHPFPRVPFLDGRMYLPRLRLYRRRISSRLYGWRQTWRRQQWRLRRRRK